MKDLVVATKNRNKLAEIRGLLKGLPINVLGLFDENLSIPDIIEDGKSFKENAVKKACAVAKLTGKLTIADDSGIEVDALSGQPGVYSKRFAGENATDRENNLKLLKLLRDIPNEGRTAQFVCVIAIAKNEKEVETVEGICRGIIGHEEKGSGGFGYDPLFIYPDYNKSLAELGPDIKNKISHRARALEKAKIVLERIIFAV